MCRLLCAGKSKLSSEPSNEVPSKEIQAIVSCADKSVDCSAGYNKRYIMTSKGRGSSSALAHQVLKPLESVQNECSRFAPRF